MNTSTSRRRLAGSRLYPGHLVAHPNFSEPVRILEITRGDGGTDDLLELIVRHEDGGEAHVKVFALDTYAIHPYERHCRDCGDAFDSDVPDTSSKWGRTCGSCIHAHL